MTATPKTIQIFLPDGDPRGIRVAEITTRIVQVIEVPRSLLADFFAMSESNQVAAYFLFCRSEDGADPHVYIGQSGNLQARLADHHKKKDFWERALVLISRTSSLTQTHALFLEWYCLQEARKAGRYVDENGNSGNRPHTPKPLESDCLEIFETGRILLSTLGFPIFDAVAAPSAGSADDEIFFCKASGAKGRGRYTSEGFVVLEGSTGRRSVVPSFEGTHWERSRNALLTAGVLKAEGDLVVFTRDHLFNSPTSAAVALMGRSANGWVDWKNEADQTLDSLKRQSVSA